MIIITEDLYIGHFILASSTEVSFRCPFCGIKQVVSTMLPYCYHCGEQLVDARTLLENKNYALKYHFNEIDDHGLSNIVYDYEV